MKFLYNLHKLINGYTVIIPMGFQCLQKIFSGYAVNGEVHKTMLVSIPIRIISTKSGVNARPRLIQPLRYIFFNKIN